MAQTARRAADADLALHPRQAIPEVNRKVDTGARWTGSTTSALRSLIRSPRVQLSQHLVTISSVIALIVDEDQRRKKIMGRDTEQVIQQMVATGKWSDRFVRLSLRADFKCEYCGLDFLASPENYKQWQCDHIVPRRRGGSEDFDNLAATCRTCNFSFKGHWDPRKRVGPSATRACLIKAAKWYIAERKRLTEQQIAREKLIMGRA
ncbi:HNH endonuclease [Bradyrhizobium sp. USDA 10063]